MFGEVFGAFAEVLFIEIIISIIRIRFIIIRWQ